MSLTTMEMTVLEYISSEGMVPRLRDRFCPAEISAIRPGVMEKLIDEGVIGHTMGRYGPVMYFMSDDDWRNNLS